MGWRFRKSFKILPGIRLNIGKKGFSSATVGKQGLSASIGRLGIFRNIGIPGTGLSHRRKIAGSPSALGAFIGLAFVGVVIVGVISLCVIFAAIGRNTDRQEQPKPARLVSNVPTVQTPQPTTSNSTKKSTVNRKEKSRSGTSDPKRSSQYVLGPRGGCYYINSTGKKTYVDHSKCG
jgi:Protein of unknown function (DUF4236)